jgi:hypothetical protein
MASLFSDAYQLGTNGSESKSFLRTEDCPSLTCFGRCSKSYTQGVAPSLVAITERYNDSEAVGNRHYKLYGRLIAAVTGVRSVNGKINEARIQ